VFYLVTAAHIFEFSLVMNSTPNKPRQVESGMHNDSLKFLTGPVRLLCNASPETMCLAHTVKIKDVPVSRGQYIESGGGESEL
jgi:hypothetical protein